MLTDYSNGNDMIVANRDQVARGAEGKKIGSKSASSST